MIKIDPNTLLADCWTGYENFDALFRRMIKLRDTFVPFSKDVYRVVHPKWSGEGDRLSGLGAKQYGGRWNPAGLGAVYGSLTPIGASKESFSQAMRYGFRAEQMTPRIIFAFRVTLSATLNLTDGAIRQRLRVSEKSLLECDWKQSRCQPHREHLPQAVGRAAVAAGLEGLLIPSAESDEINAVIFPDFLKKTSQLITLNADDITG